MKKLIGALALAALPAIAHAAPTQWTVGSGGNGHYYEFISAPTSWTNALAAAATATPLAGYTSYLATSTSAAENAFMASLANNTFYLSGTDAAVEGTWVWAAGPEAGTVFFGPGAAPGSYTNWNSGEPNNVGVENYLHASFGNTGGWNDIPDNYQGTGYGYMVEYSLAAGNGVPEPASWAMMIGGFGVAGLASRRRRRSAAVTA